MTVMMLMTRIKLQLVITVIIDNHDSGDKDDVDDDLYIIGAVCISVSCDEKVTSSLICSATCHGGW